MVTKVLRRLDSAAHRSARQCDEERQRSEHVRQGGEAVRRDSEARRHGEAARGFNKETNIEPIDPIRRVRALWAVVAVVRWAITTHRTAAELAHRGKKQHPKSTINGTRCTPDHLAKQPASPGGTETALMETEGHSSRRETSCGSRRHTRVVSPQGDLSGRAGHSCTGIAGNCHFLLQPDNGRSTLWLTNTRRLVRNRQTLFVRIVFFY